MLRTFVWAFPHQYDAEAPADTAVQVGLGTGGTWHLVRDDDGWTLEQGAARRPAAVLHLHETAAWPQLTGLAVPQHAVHTDGPDHLVGPLLQVRGIIA